MVTEADIAAAKAAHTRQGDKNSAGQPGGCKLWEIKPDMRLFRFNHPNPKDETGFHGYEAWITIPDDMDVPEPLTKKHFKGGLYAAHMIEQLNFDWESLIEWIHNSEKYEFAGDFADQEHMCGLLDEHLNYVSHAQ